MIKSIGRNILVGLLIIFNKILYTLKDFKLIYNEKNIYQSKIIDISIYIVSYNQQYPKSKKD